MSNNKSEKRHPFSSDRPISEFKDDLLDRQDFSRAIATAIAEWKQRDSLLIALYGGWGTGKTSLKNLIVNHLRTYGKSGPEILEFNPWQWSGEDKLTEAFFSELSLAIGKSSSRNSTRKAAEHFKYYGALLRATSHVTDVTTSPAIAFLSIFGIAPVFLYMLLGESWLAPILFGLSIMAIGFAAVLKWATRLLESIASALELRAKSSSLTLIEEKSEIGKLFQQLDRPILVILDDIDRLMESEIRLIFRLLKANADLPNVVYLLPFQRDIVEHALDVEGSTTGRSYLEKIVQVGFNIPAISPAKLEKILIEGLNHELSDASLIRHFDRQRWASIYYGGLKSLFRSLRDIRRYLSSFSFSVSLFRKDGAFEVNPVDLIALEALRQFEPDVYSSLPRLKSFLLAENKDWTPFSEERDKSNRRELQQLLDISSEGNRNVLGEVLGQLFPNAAWFFCNSNANSGAEDSWFRAMRVAHPDVFDKYFQFVIPQGEISQADICRFEKSLGDREALVSEYRDLQTRGLLNAFMVRLEDYKMSIPLEHASSLVTSIFDIGDDLDLDSTPGLRVRPEMNAVRVVYHYLKREKDLMKRTTILSQAIEKTTGLFLPVRQVSLEDESEIKKRDPDDCLVSPEALLALRLLCLEKIRLAATQQQLLNHPKMLYLLFRWGEWSSYSEPVAWVAEMTMSRDGIFRFLRACMTRISSQRMHDYLPEVRWHIDLKCVERFIATSVLESKLEDFGLTGATEEELVVAATFRESLHFRREGKENDIYARFDDDD
jgi:predicted KAP-like P-loop ATPase